MLWHFIVILEDIFNSILTHSHTIILDGKIDVVAFFLTAHGNHAAVILVHISNTIIDCIFQNRLYDKLDRTIIIDLLVNVKLHLEPLFIAHKLDIHIASAVLQLVRNPDYRSALRQTDPKQLRKLGNHEHRFLVLLCLDHPCD